MRQVTRANAPAKPAPARVIALVRSEDAALVEKVAHRLDYEFGILPVESASGNAGAIRWLALNRIVDPSTLPDLENHGLRIAALYGADEGESTVDINFGLASAVRVIRAERFDKPDCIYLGDGIWAELVCRRDVDADPWIMQNEIDLHWSDEDTLKFVSGVADLACAAVPANAAKTG